MENRQGQELRAQVNTSVFYRIVNIMFAVLFFGVVLLAIFNNKSTAHTFSWPLLLVSAAVGVALVFGASRLFSLLPVPNKSAEIVSVCGGMLLFAALSLMVGFALVGPPPQGTDFGMMYQRASAYVLSGARPDHYFLYYPTHSGFYVLLTALFSLFKLFGATSFMVPLMVLNTLAVCGAVLLMYFCARRLFGVKKALFILVASVFTVPFLLSGPVAYTYTLTLPVPAAIVLLWMKTRGYWRGGNAKKATITFAVLAGIAALGALIKLSVLVVFVAVLLDLLILLSGKGKLRVLLAGTGVCAAVLLLGTLLINSSPALPEYDRAADGIPMNSWIMMGLSRNGAFNQEDLDLILTRPDMAARADFVNQEIANRLRDYMPFGIFTHLGDKLAYTFGDPTLGLSQQLEGEATGGLQGLFLPAGGGFAGLFFFAFGVQMGVLVWMSVAAIKSLYRKNDALTFARLALLGLAVFLLIWKTEPGEIVLFVPLFLLCGLEASPAPMLAMQKKRARQALQTGDVMSDSAQTVSMGSLEEDLGQEYAQGWLSEHINVPLAADNVWPQEQREETLPQQSGQEPLHMDDNIEPDQVELTVEPDVESELDTEPSWEEPAYAADVAQAFEQGYDVEYTTEDGQIFYQQPDGRTYYIAEDGQAYYYPQQEDQVYYDENGQPYYLEENPDEPYVQQVFVGSADGRQVYYQDYDGQTQEAYWDEETQQWWSAPPQAEPPHTYGPEWQQEYEELNAAQLQMQDGADEDVKVWGAEEELEDAQPQPTQGQQPEAEFTEAEPLEMQPELTGAVAEELEILEAIEIPDTLKEPEDIEALEELENLEEPGTWEAIEKTDEAGEYSEESLAATPKIDDETSLGQEEPELTLWPEVAFEPEEMPAEEEPAAQEEETTFFWEQPYSLAVPAELEEQPPEQELPELFDPQEIDAAYPAEETWEEALEQAPQAVEEAVVLEEAPEEASQAVEETAVLQETPKQAPQIMEEAVPEELTANVAGAALFDLFADEAPSAEPTQIFELKPELTLWPDVPEQAPVQEEEAQIQPAEPAEAPVAKPVPEEVAQPAAGGESEIPVEALVSDIVAAALAETPEISGETAEPPVLELWADLNADEAPKLAKAHEAPVWQQVSVPQDSVPETAPQEETPVPTPDTVEKLLAPAMADETEQMVAEEEYFFELLPVTEVAEEEGTEAEAITEAAFEILPVMYVPEEEEEALPKGTEDEESQRAEQFEQDEQAEQVEQGLEGTVLQVEERADEWLPKPELTLWPEAEAAGQATVLPEDTEDFEQEPFVLFPMTEMEETAEIDLFEAAVQAEPAAQEVPEAPAASVVQEAPEAPGAPETPEEHPATAKPREEKKLPLWLEIELEEALLKQKQAATEAEAEAEAKTDAETEQNVFSMLQESGAVALDETALDQTAPEAIGDLLEAVPPQAEPEPAESVPDVLQMLDAELGRVTAPEEAEVRNTGALLVGSAPERTGEPAEELAAAESPVIAKEPAPAAAFDAIDEAEAPAEKPKISDESVDDIIAMLYVKRKEQEKLAEEVALESASQVPEPAVEPPVQPKAAEIAKTAVQPQLAEEPATAVPVYAEALPPEATPAPVPPVSKPLDAEQVELVMRALEFATGGKPIIPPTVKNWRAVAQAKPLPTLPKQWTPQSQQTKMPRQLVQPIVIPVAGQPPVPPRQPLVQPMAPMVAAPAPQPPAIQPPQAQPPHPPATAAPVAAMQAPPAQGAQGQDWSTLHRAINNGLPGGQRYGVAQPTAYDELMNIVNHAKPDAQKPKE